MMKKILGLCCGIVAISAVVSGQTPQPASSSAAAMTPQSTEIITVIGCVTTDSGAASASSQRFVLSNLQSPPDRPDRSPQAAAASYGIFPNSDLSLSQHVGHRVEMTGYLESSSSRGTSSTMPVFHASSVRMLSDSCS